MSDNSSIINENNHDDEISLWELIFKVRDIFKYLFSKWLLLLFIGIIGGAIGLLYAFSKKTQYIANLTFVLEDSKSSSLGAYSGIASQFGIDLGENSSSGVFSGDNILEFLKSRLIVEHALLADTVLDNKSSTLADLYLNVYGFKTIWKDKPGLRDISFPPNSNPGRFSLLQDSVMQVLYESILLKNLVVEKPDKKLGFIMITTTSVSEEFSQLFTEKLVNGAIEFYVSTKTQRSRANVNNLQKQADSLVNLLDKKTYSLAVNQDLNQNPARKVALIDAEISTRDKTLLSTMYAEVIRNLEMAKMTLVQETPIIQIVDTPLLPLKKKHTGRITSFIVGGFLFVVFSCIFLVAKKAYRAAIAKEKQSSDGA
jgi:hypothetical protein